MNTARLVIADQTGNRTIPVEGPVMTLGRRSECAIRLAGSDVSRDHADIAIEEGRFILRDRASRFGTFVNGQKITEYQLVHGDTIRLGQSADCQIVFEIDGAGASTSVTKATSAVGDLRQVSVLLDGLRALGSGRVLDEVLTMVIDSWLHHARRAGWPA
jgi:pSer/pThr/pTyr-binding forkhead associated (FHA) protein